MRSQKIKFYLLSLSFALCTLHFTLFSYAEDIEEPNVAGKFYPEDKIILSQQIENFLTLATPEQINGDIFCLISPHAGYDFSAQTAAFGYKLIRNKPYKTVIVIGPSHFYGFDGISVYAKGKFRTPLGDLEIDGVLADKIIGKFENINFLPQAFKREHSIEVQLPFLQKTLSDFKIVPILTGQCDFKTLQNLSESLVNAIGKRKDVLLVASSDFYHGYDWQEAELIDNLTISYLKNMSAGDIYEKLQDGTIQMCGGLPVVEAILTAKALGHEKITILNYTNSAIVTGKRRKGTWTVGYVSAVIDQEESEDMMLDDTQKKRLLEIARKTIEEYVINSKTLDFNEDDPKLNEICGAFVTLHKHGALRGCIGNIIGQQALFKTIRDMSIESATRDPRFPPIEKDELKDIEIEISVLSPLKKITDINELELGIHGVLIRRGRNQGIFLPQVATETGWSKEEFLSNLCAHKAGLPADSWKDASTEKFIFSATVFSEKEL